MFTTSVESTSSLLEISSTCHEILQNDDSFSLFCQLYTLMTKDQQVIGPNYIGFSQERIKKFVAEMKSSKSSSRGGRSFSKGSRGRFRSSSFSPRSSSSSFSSRSSSRRSSRNFRKAR